MESVDRTKPVFLPAETILARAISGEGGLVGWSIDAAYPESDDTAHPRVGRFYAMYTLENGTWVNISHSGAKAKELLHLLTASALAAEADEWATAYDDPPRDADEEPFGVGPEGKQKLMAYRGRIWDITPSSAVHPYDSRGGGIDEEIETFSSNDVGSCCYYEKKDGVFQMVIG